MKKILFLSSVAMLFAMVASAGTVTYSTAGSTLLCNGVATCVQNNATSVTVGNLTVIYNPAGATVVTVPPVFPYSNINLGTLDITCSGSCSSTSFSTLLLTLNVLSTPPGSAGNLPNGQITGNVAVSSSNASINFGAANTTSSLGSYPGIYIGQVLYQVTNSPLALVPPTSGGPGGFGETSIQGLVQDTPEPGTLILMSAGLGLVLLGRRRGVK